MNEKQKMTNAIAKLIFGKHTSANRKHISNLFKKLHEYEEKHPDA